jgi:thiamine kinase-like enzyme
LAAIGDDDMGRREVLHDRSILLVIVVRRLLLPHSKSDTPAFIPAFLLAAYKRHPELELVTGPPQAAEVCDGLSNHVLRVTGQMGVFFVRLAAGGAGVPVDRRSEAHNLRLAADLGLAIAPAFVDPATGILVTEALMELEAGSGELPERLGERLARLHGSGAQFKGNRDARVDFEVLHSQIRKSGCAAKPDHPLGDYLERVEELAALFDGFDHHVREAFVPSHGDLSPGNCLMARDRLWLIDWEFSGMADPCWDLAYAIQEHGFDTEAERRFLQAYECRRDQAISRERMRVMKAWCDGISALWAVSQIAQGRDRHVFMPFAEERFARAFACLRQDTGATNGG